MKQTYFHPALWTTVFSAPLMQEAGSEGVITDDPEDDLPTSINAIQTTDLDGTEHYYDLNGRRLPGRPDHGIYIHNGRKVLAE